MGKFKTDSLEDVKRLRNTISRKGLVFTGVEGLEVLLVAVLVEVPGEVDGDAAAAVE